MPLCLYINRCLKELNQCTQYCNFCRYSYGLSSHGCNLKLQWVYVIPGDAFHLTQLELHLHETGSVTLPVYTNDEMG